VELTWGTPPTALAAALEGLISRGPGRVALAWLDATTGRGWTWDDRTLPAASLVKVPLAIAAYAAAERNELLLRERVAVAPIPEDDEAEFDDLGQAPAGKPSSWRKVIDRMITESDNAATNALIDRLGLGALNDLIQRLGLKHTTLSRRMIDAAARQAGRENFTTAAEAAAVLLALYRGELLAPAGTAELLALLGQQRHDEKLAAGLPGTLVFRHKTGELPHYRHDAGIVEHTRPYILVALAETSDGREAETDRLLSFIASVVHAHHEGVTGTLAQAQDWLLQLSETFDPRLEISQLRLEPGDPVVLAGHTTVKALLAPPEALHLQVSATQLEPQRGVVIVPCLQLRGGPGHSYELVSQLRLGEPIEVLELGEDWHRLRGPDGYIAFGRANNVRLDVDWRPTHRVTQPLLTVPLDDQRALVLSAGSCLTAAGLGHYRLPNGTVVAIDSGVTPLELRGDIASALSFARAFLGLPYLWGGTTGWGLDCSGLVQLVYAVSGVLLPRDADQQQAACAPLATIDELAPGDLVFFPGHVGLALGQGQYIHASAQSAMLTINSFNPHDALYDAKLHGMFSGGGRSPLGECSPAVSAEVSRGAC
jgi:beta-lactamase class A